MSGLRRIPAHGRRHIALMHNPEWSRAHKVVYWIGPVAITALAASVVAPSLWQDAKDDTLVTHSRPGVAAQGPPASEIQKRPNNPFDIKGKKVKVPHDPAYKGKNMCPWTPENPQPTKEVTVTEYAGHSLRQPVRLPAAALDIRCSDDATAPLGHVSDGNPRNKHFYTYSQPMVLPGQETHTDMGKPEVRKYYSKAIYGACALRGLDTVTDTNGIQTDVWDRILVRSEGGDSQALPGSQMYVPAAAFGYAPFPACPEELQYRLPHERSTWEQIKHDVGELFS